MQKLAAFDLEIARTMEEGDFDWKAKRPLGITCAQIIASGPDMPGDQWDVRWYGEPKLTADECKSIVQEMQWMTKEGYLIVTVNGIGFDFDILAEESGMWAECADLALHHHCDLMMMSVCELGWRTGLDAFAKGAGVESKLKSVTLADGRILEGMDGGKAPELWAAGECEAVLAYLAQDVRSTLETAETAVLRKRLEWRSSKGKLWRVGLTDGRLPTVMECLGWPRPNVSWMDDPPEPFEICEWALEAENAAAFEEYVRSMAKEDGRNG